MSTEIKTIFGLIRHGKTSWNLEKRIQGKNNPGLCSQGVKEVQGWGKILGNTLKWDCIISSNLQRTWETAKIINKDLGLPITKDNRLDEQDWGLWTGKTKETLMTGQIRELEREMAAGWKFCPPGGENRVHVWHRSRDALSNAAKQLPGKNILVVTHIGVIKSVVYGIMKRKFLPDEPPVIKPYYLHILAWEKDNWVIKSLNHCSLS